MSGVSASLPDLGAASDAAANVQTGLGGLLSLTASLTTPGPDAPLNAVSAALAGLQTHLHIDISGLSEGLPRAFTTIEHALPPDALRLVETLDGAYRTLSGLLADHALVQQIQSGASLEQTALALVDGVLAQFSQRLADLGTQLIDADTLAQVREALAMLDQLAGGTVPPPDELLGFLSHHLVGLEHTLLASAQGELGTALSQLEPLAQAAFQARLAGPGAALDAAFRPLAIALRDFDPAELTHYAALEGLLQTWADAINTAFDALEAGYDAAQVVVDQAPLQALFDAHATALEAVPLDQVPTVDDAVQAMAGLIESLLARLSMSLSPQDLAAQVQRVSASVHEMFAQSGLAQVRQILLDFIASIRDAVEAVPADDARRAVTGMLRRVHQELDALGIARVRSGIAEGFSSAHAFIHDQIGNDLLAPLAQALDTALHQLDNLPIEELGTTLADAVRQIGGVIDQLDAELGSALDELVTLLARLDTVDYRPLADEVVDEITALKIRLAAIRPESLSDVEKVALQAGLAILRAIDLESFIETNLNQGYAALDDELVQAVNTALNAWLDLRQRLGVFDGAALAAPITQAFADIQRAVASVDGAGVLAPLQQLIDQLTAQAEGLNPAALLQPLEAPYGRMMATINRANPDVWVAPLRVLHGEIDRVITLIDITPLLTTLERKERELFAQARDGLAAALESVHLPPPLDSFLDTMKALVLGLADAVFGDPDGTLRRYSLDLNGSLRPSSLFQPLDAVFDRLVAALDTLPPEQMLAALEDIRLGLGVALPALDPAAILAGLRRSEAGLAQMSPGALTGLAALPALRARLQATLEAQVDLSVDLGLARASLQARLALTLDPLSLQPEAADDAASPLPPGLPPTRLARLDARHRALVTALRLRLNTLDTRRAQAAYTQLAAGLVRVLPPFLRQSRPLTLGDVRSGLAALRPSTQARRIDEAVDRFLARLAPLQTALDGSINGFFSEIRNTALVLHPGGLKDAVAEVYAALRDRLAVLDPDALAAQLR
ncbi:MAG: hypothetical protein RL722_1063, partial [Pseudomonadota bacterium]